MCSGGIDTKLHAIVVKQYKQKGLVIVQAVYLVIVDAYRVHDFWYKRVVATRYNMLGANPNLHNLPIYHEVEKVPGNIFVTDGLISVFKSSNIFPDYAFT